MIGLTNVLDRWLFKLTPEKGETFGKHFWWIVIAGFVGGISLAISAFSGKKNEDQFNTVTIICLIVAGVLAIWYGIKNIPQIEGGVGTKIFRGVYILIWGLIGFFLGVAAGAFVVVAVILFIILYIFLHMVFNVDMGGGSSKSNNNSNNDDKNDGSVELSDGTIIKQDSGGTWRNTSDWSDTYTQHGSDRFSQDN